MITTPVLSVMTPPRWMARGWDWVDPLEGGEGLSPDGTSWLHDQGADRREAWRRLLRQPHRVSLVNSKQPKTLMLNLIVDII